MYGVVIFTSELIKSRFRPLLLEQFLLQPFLQPREIVCVICGGFGGFEDLPGICLLFYTALL